MLYVYALLGSEPRENPGAGLQGETLRLAPCGELFALVGEMEEAPPVQERTLRGHERTVRRAADSVDAILPARFGSVVPDDHALFKLLEKRGAELRQALALVRGREQMTLRVYDEAATPAPEPAAEDEDLMGPGARYLAQKMKSRGAGSLAAFEKARPALAPLVQAESIQRHDAPPLVASVYHLIERGRSAEYLAALKSVELGDIADGSARLTASGPWPPYAFAHGEWL